MALLLLTPNYSNNELSAAKAEPGLIHSTRSRAAGAANELNESSSAMLSAQEWNLFNSLLSFFKQFSREFKMSLVRQTSTRGATYKAAIYSNLCHFSVVCWWSSQCRRSITSVCQRRRTFRSSSECSSSAPTCPTRPDRSTCASSGRAGSPRSTSTRREHFLKNFKKF